MKAYDISLMLIVLGQYSVDSLAPKAPARIILNYIKYSAKIVKAWIYVDENGTHMSEN